MTGVESEHHGAWVDAPAGEGLVGAPCVPGDRPRDGARALAHEDRARDQSLRPSPTRRPSYKRGPGRTEETLGSRFQHLAQRGLLHIDDAALAAQHFIWLVLSVPLNRAMLTGEEDFTEAELERYADEATRVFLAAYR